MQPRDIHTPPPQLMQAMFDAFNDFSAALCGQGAAAFLSFEFMMTADHFSMKEAFLRKARQKDAQ